MEEKIKKCSVSKKCGSCQYQGVPYKEQLVAKQKKMSKLLKKFGNVKPIIGMEDPFYYRNKVHAVFDRDRKGNISLLVEYMRSGMEVRTVTDYGTFIPVSDTQSFASHPGQQVSIINFGAED